MRHWILKAISCLVIFFFAWTSGGLFNVAYAAYNETPKPPVNQKQQQRPEEKFQKVIEDIRSIIHDKSAFETRKGQLKAKRSEIDSSDSEIKSQFAVTEKKLKDAKLPQEILQRHYNFVKHYEDNLKELRTNLDAADIAKTKAEFDTQLQKVQQHLEKVVPPRKHKALDPNKLPHRISDIKRKEPRTKPEEFQKDIKQRASLSLRAVSQTAWQSNDARLLRSARNDTTAVIPACALQGMQTGIQENLNNFVIPAKAGIQDTINNNKPLLFAANGPLTGLVEKLPKHEGQQNLPHLLFKKEGSNAFNSPPFLKGDKGQSPANAGGFSNNISEPIVLALAHDAPTDADLAATIDVQLTPAIRAKAAELNYSPVKIYNWVRNNVEYVPTYGSIQGADMCLQTLQGNDFDIASLLIALLRASNIPARYVYGTIELPIDKVMNWVGGFTNAQAALNFIASGGTPVAGGISGGKISSVRMEHVWVEAYIPYGNYRGSMRDQSIKTWIPMDGSYKQYTFTNRMDITTILPFDQNNYLAQVQTANPIHYYQNQIQNYLDANLPDKTILDVKEFKEIVTTDYEILSATLPYKEIGILNRYSSLPANFASRVNIILSDAEGLSEITYTGATSEIAGKRITISYVPATSDDESLISSYGGYMYDVPAYLLNLKPVLKIDGNVVLTGDAVAMGFEQKLMIKLMQVSENEEMIEKKLVAGAYYAVAIDSQGINENVLGQRNGNLISNINTQTAQTLQNDDLIGEHLFILALTYFRANDKLYSSGAKIYNIGQIRTLSEGIASFNLSVSYMFSVPNKATPAGIEIDVAADRIIAVSKEGDRNKVKAYNDIAGLMTSYNEHDIFEKIDEFSAVSAVKALQAAKATGIPVYLINSTNAGQIIPLLQVEQKIITDIQNAVNAGKEVTVSQTTVQIDDWNGTGYIIKDPATGNGAYMISGGLAGGSSTKNSDGMQIVQIFKGAYGWLKDELDIFTRSNIVYAAELDIGEMIAIRALAMADHLTYEQVDACTGLVIKSYKGAANIDLIKLAKEAGYSGKMGAISNVSNMYLFIKGNPDYWVGNGEPIKGDIIFFTENPYKRSDSLKRSGDDNVTHVGIVTGVKNSQVTKFVHAPGSKKLVTESDYTPYYWKDLFLGLGRPR